ncbi:hypothetical protein [Pseudobythopirellula maris]|uniref:hypothetical protein n=1 Tax=Pseudobythopirellula maris TaxID=2527991 RepID=UPI0011B61DCB|nr:hypothetical protein [Pseudobythopirellula maris]
MGRPAAGEIVDGRYEIPRSEGPFTGEYRVMIYAERPSGRTMQADESGSETLELLEQYLPSTYNDRTTLEAWIDGDRLDLDFPLEKPRAGGRRKR